MRILLVEDNPSFQQVVSEVLSPLGHEVAVAGTAREARAVLQDSEVQLLLLDMGLPDQDGLEFCASLQSDTRLREIPIMVISGRIEVSHKVAAFAVGVEDYILKPVHPLEFRARIEARLKRIRRAQEREEVLVRGPFTLNVPQQRVYTREGVDLRLTPLEFRILYQLARREERVLTRAQLLDLAWGQDVNVLDRTVDAHISILRKKLGPHSACIGSIAGQGYCFSGKPRT